MKERAQRPTLNVEVSATKNLLKVSTADDMIEFQSDDSVPLNRARREFAAWLFLPIAMRLGRDLHVRGQGSLPAEANARRLSEIWSRWLPGHFSMVDVTFLERFAGADDNLVDDDLYLYSGGIDSTYALLKRIRAAKTQTLLTIHGMDYRFDDEQKFDCLIDKTSRFAKLAGKQRVLVRTNAYDVYKKYSINPDKPNPVTV